MNPVKVRKLVIHLILVQDWSLTIGGPIRLSRLRNRGRDV